MSSNTINSFIRSRRALERAAGLAIIEAIEAGRTVADITGEGRLIRDGRAASTDHEAIAAVALCGASRARISATIEALRAAADAR
jgi:hypothetical protein